jgi:hypothetical protein
MSHSFPTRRSSDLTYGFKGAGIIFWWIGDRKAIKAKTYNLIDDDGTINVVSNVNQLYKLILKLK